VPEKRLWIAERLLAHEFLSERNEQFGLGPMAARYLDNWNT
jgi:hypothetical protein